jgi:tRNA pseudouridine55 synthase
VPVDGPALSRETVTAALEAFRGPIEQVPPDHSAVHVGGKRAYEVARKGDKPELSSRKVTIHSLELTNWDDSEAGRPVAELEVRCSAGTYVRALARDLGSKVDSGAYLGSLTRTASGPFHIQEAHSLDKVREELSHGRTEQLLLPPDAGLDSIPQVQVPASDMAAIARGQIIRLHSPLPRPEGVTPSDSDDPLVRLIDEEGRLAAMAHVRKGRIYPSKVFVSPEA